MESRNLTVGGLGAAGVLNGAVSDTRLGGMLGGGLEYGFMPGWSAKLEYGYFDFGKSNFDMPITTSGAIAGPGAGTATFSLPIGVVEQIHTIRAGVNSRFDSPLVAKSELTFHLRQAQGPGLVRGFLRRTRSLTISPASSGTMLITKIIPHIATSGATI